MSEERENGGLFALTVDDADRLLSWGRYLFAANEEQTRDFLLHQRIAEWRRRHTEDAS